MSYQQLKWDITCMDKKVPIAESDVKITEIYGGFGRDEKILTVPQIAAIHTDDINDDDLIKKRIKRINELINNNIVLDSGDYYFEHGIDILDLKKIEDKNVLKDLKKAGIYTQAQIGNSKNLYILSEQGYSLLINLMGDTRSKLIYKNVIRDYFKIRRESLTHEDTEQHILRFLGKKERKKTTDTIKYFIERGDIEHDSNDIRKNAYARETNFIYKVLFGMTAKEIENYLELDLKKYDTVRNHLCMEDIDAIMSIEGRIAYMKEDGYSYNDIKKRLNELHPEKRTPRKAEKSIHLITRMLEM